MVYQRQDTGLKGSAQKKQSVYNFLKKGRLFSKNSPLKLNIR